MLTKQGKRLFAYGVGNVVGTGTNGIAVQTLPTGMIEINPTDGTGPFYFNGVFYGFTVSTFLSGDPTANGKVGIAVGSGAAAESDTSICLASPITSGVSGSVSLVGIQYESQTDKATVTYSVTITNASGSDIIVNEVGLFGNVAGYATTKGGAMTTGANYRKTIMLDRTVLDSAVTIPSGQSRVIDYKFVRDCSY